VDVKVSLDGSLARSIGLGAVRRGKRKTRKMGAAKSRILVVEDDPVIRDLVAELLGIEGYACTMAMSCGEARQKVQEDSFACGLIDLGLPDGNGLRLLPDLRQSCPWLVPIILTGDSRAETIVETIRAGAFDYLMKPFSGAALSGAVSRALEHHDAIHERDRLFQLLSTEREQLKVRVADATADLRQYATQIETINARLQSLLRLTQMSASFYTDENLFRGTFEELEKHLPVYCVALCGWAAQDFVAAIRGEDGEVRVIVSDAASSVPLGETARDAKQPQLLASLVERHTGLDTNKVALFPYLQHFWGRRLCTVGFFLSSEFDVDPPCDEFLGMCAHFLATEWQEAQLLLHAVRGASLGDIAFELYKGFIQGLTAIRTAADVAEETRAPQEASEALKIICANVESLQRQIQEFRQLSSQRKDSVETVYLDQYIDQAIQMLSMAIQSRGIEILKDYQAKCECILLNGSTLARTFLDLISSAVRTVETGGQIVLRLTDADSDTILFQICCDGINAGLFAEAASCRPAADSEVVSGASVSPRSDVKAHPKFLLAQRTVRSCGGRLTVEQPEGGRLVFRIQLPRNALNPSPAGEVND
jgi:DNA-binding response OmpR family regulator